MNFIKTPYLQLPETDGITVMWETDRESTSKLLVWKTFCPEIGVVQYNPQGEPRIFYGEDGYMHKVKAFGLESGRDYCYQVISTVGSEELASEKYWGHVKYSPTINIFRTRTSENENISFVVTSETGGSKSTLQTRGDLVEAITVERPDFLLFIGDMVQDGRKKHEWDDYLFTPFRSLICNTPFYHCAGNHEHNTDFMKQFLATSKNGYYDFDYGCAHFVALDSTRLVDHIDEQENYFPMRAKDLTEENPQVRFLTESLRKSNAKWKFVYMHYPPYCSGTYHAAALRPLCRIFEKYGVDLVFTSHTLVYERSHPLRNASVDFLNGIRYMVLGGAGSRPKWFHHKKAWHTAKSCAIPHFAHVSVTPEYLEFQAIDLDGKLFDNFVIQKCDQ
ncbi:MAG: metallophosphoesterase family protein [Spirochaetaceae bacterium]|nr:metallophosphoesterase family protein [Spirochaetaceae bacterium]